MEKEILDGNRLIAEFMGYQMAIAKKDEPHFVGKGITCRSGFGESVYFKNEDEYKNFMNPKYHSSWDWLMPVVEKIENIKDTSGNYQFSFDLGRDFCIIRYNDLSGNPIVASSEQDNKLLSIWQAIVKFIQWYTQQPKITT